MAASVAALAASLVSGLDLGMAIVFTLLTGLGWPFVAFACGLYAAEDLRSWASGISEMPRLVVAALLTSWPLFAALRLMEAPNPARGALLAAVGTALLALPSRGTARGFVHLSEPLRQRTVIVGSGRVAARLIEKLRAHHEFGLNPIGIVDDEVYEAENLDLPVLGRLTELTSVLRTQQVDRVIIAFSRADHEELLSSIRACRDARIAVDVVPRLFEFLDGARALDQIGGLPLISIGAHRLSRVSRLAKRGFDIILSAVALVVLAPLFALVALAVRIESRGKVFFRQSRAGQGGQVFRLLKFRSMYADAELRVDDFRENGVVLKGGDDPRITRIGRILRRLSIDELPQLINVFLGHMSLVGPRPQVAREVALYDHAMTRRLHVRPGMTGLWQVSGRSDLTLEEAIRLDLYYVDNWSMLQDISILARTARAVLGSRGAY